jgi:hypothetical protein
MSSAQIAPSFLPRCSTGGKRVAGVSPFGTATSKVKAQIAQAQSVLFGGIEDFLVTREVSNRATHEEKLALLHFL